MEGSKDTYYLLESESKKFTIVTLWHEEIPKVANAGWVHRAIDSDAEGTIEILKKEIGKEIKYEYSKRNS